MKVPFLDVAALHEEMRAELDAALRRVLDSGRFVLGEEVEAFEAEFAAYVGAAHCVSVGNGLDALALTLRALGVGPGDEVMVPSHTFIATWLAVDLVGAVPVPVEPRPGTYLMDPIAAGAAATRRTRAVIPVHLYGEPAELTPLREMCAERGLALVEDAAQAHGATYRGRPVGADGTATWSFYPGKNLGALGDAGAVTTNDADVATSLRALRNYGSTTKYVHDVAGVNSRLDEMQAALLRVKLSHLDHHQARRREIAARYRRGLANLPLAVPEPAADVVSSWHLFVVRCAERDRLQTLLSEAGVATQVHYPLAVHQQGAYATRGLTGLPLAEEYAATVLSLPMDPTMSDEAVDHVVASVVRAVAQVPATAG